MNNFELKTSEIKARMQFISSMFYNSNILPTAKDIAKLVKLFQERDFENNPTEAEPVMRGFRWGMETMIQALQMEPYYTGRRCGNSTRIIDKAVQTFFINDWCWIKDHHDSHAAHQHTAQRFIDRLQFEHRLKKENLTLFSVHIKREHQGYIVALSTLQDHAIRDKFRYAVEDSIPLSTIHLNKIINKL